MELRPGFKPSEAGVIPFDWEVRRLDEVVHFLDGQRRPVKDTDRAKMRGEIPYYGASGVVDYVNDYLFDEDLILLGEDGENILSRASRLAFRVSGRTWVNNHAHVLKPKQGHDIGYLAEFLESLSYDQYNTGTAQPKLNKQVCSAIPVAVPSQSEQRAIATALSDMDALLAKLDQLIAKKRDLKQAAMQQLLTGQTRLPGFSGEWEVKRFGEVAAPRGDRIDPRTAGVQAFCIELEHIEPGSGQLLGSGSTGEHSSLKSVFQAGDVLFGKLRAYLRKYWLADRPGVCSTEIWALAARINVVAPAFLFQLVMSDRFTEAASTAYGTHMPRSDWNVVKNHEFAVPKIDEQTAIATILSDTDAELTALAARRDKTRALKQGMMQELLTGRIRLV